MKNFHDESIYQIFKILGSILLGALLNTMLFSAKNIKESTRQFALTASCIVTMLNAWGIWRNTYTTIHFGTIWDKIWLVGNMMQFLLTLGIFFVVYKRMEIKRNLCLFLLLNCLVWLPYNFYSFMINFGYLKEEGALIFCIWFVKNGGMILFSAAVAFLICFYRPLPRWADSTKNG